MAHRACKYVFDDIDGLIQAPHPTTYIWPAMRNYFKVSDRKGMLIHFYANFEKNEIAGFTKELVVGCEKKDPLCKLILEENGKYLAKYLNVLARKAHNVKFQRLIISTYFFFVLSIFILTFLKFYINFV